MICPSLVFFVMPPWRNVIPVRPHAQVKRVEPHTAAVNQICFDEAAEYIASCSDDGSVSVSKSGPFYTPL